MPRRVPIIIAVVLIAAAAGFFIWKSRGEGATLTASGTVEATEAQLGFQAGGRVDQILVQEGDRVTRGQVLARLDTVEVGARRAQAVAAVAVARANLLELERGSRPEEIASAKAALEAAEQKRLDAQRDFERAKKLFADGLVSQEAYDKARTAFDVAVAQHHAAAEQEALVRAGPRAETIAAQRASLQQAEASVRAYDAMLAQMTVRAPFDGVVTVKVREPGEIVPAGAAAVTIMNPDDRWVRIYIPEDRIGAVALGDSADIRSDTDPSHAYGGRVTFIASQAEFTPKSVQTKEERVRLVFAVKVKIHSDPEGDLKPGMSADVRLIERS